MVQGELAIAGAGGGVCARRLGRSCRRCALGVVVLVLGLYMPPPLGQLLHRGRAGDWGVLMSANR